IPCILDFRTRNAGKKASSSTPRRVEFSPGSGLEARCHSGLGPIPPVGGAGLRCAAMNWQTLLLLTVAAAGCTETKYIAPVTVVPTRTPGVAFVVVRPNLTSSHG